MMALTEAVAFQRLDQRHAHALLGRGSILHTTRQELPGELSTVREIVSGLLGRFDRASWVPVSRERIDVLDASALPATSAGTAPPDSPPPRAALISARAVLDGGQAAP